MKAGSWATLSNVDDVLRQAPPFTALDEEAAAALQASTVEVRLAKGRTSSSKVSPATGFRHHRGQVKLGHGTPTAGEPVGDPRAQRTARVKPLCSTLGPTYGHGADRRDADSGGPLGAAPWLTGRPGRRGAARHWPSVCAAPTRPWRIWSSPTFPGRIAKILLDLGDKFGRQLPDGLHVTHDMTQEELAQLVGASRGDRQQGTGRLRQSRLDPARIALRGAHRHRPPATPRPLTGAVRLLRRVVAQLSPIGWVAIGVAVALCWNYITIASDEYLLDLDVYRDAAEVAWARVTCTAHASPPWSCRTTRPSRSCS